MFVLVWFEPASVTKAGVAFSTTNKIHINFASPNFNELKAIHAAVSKITEFRVLNEETFSEDVTLNEIINDCLHFSNECTHYVSNLFVTLGKHGVIALTRTPFGEPFCNEKVNNFLTARFYPSASKQLLPINIKNASGAGDR